MEQDSDIYQSKNLRRFDFGDADDDLEAMQRDDMMGFAERMNEAIKEFEIKERQTADTAPVVNASDGSGGDAPKKLSLFAQRRLAKQRQGIAPVTGQPTFERNDQQSQSAATFLPKLMAPVPEHTVVEPAVAPQMQPRESGFPNIPTDFAEETTGNQVRTADSQSDVYWDSMRHQISQENESRIQGMSASEILEAQDEIRSMVSSDVIKRLLYRKQRQAGDSATQAPAEQRAEPTTTNQTDYDDSENSSIPTRNPSKQVRFADTTLDPEKQVADAAGDSPTHPSAQVPPPPPAEWVDQDGVVETDAGDVGADTVDFDNNDPGVDSPFYSEMKRKYFPSEVVEEAKLAWILGHNQAKSPMEQAVLKARQQAASAAAAATAGNPSKTSTTNGGEDAESEELLSKKISHVRFAFDGQIMTEEQSDIPTLAGLHHHGENPDKPGYTIPELLHLSRSTVPAQRSVAMSTLGCIIHKINVGAWDLEQSVEVYVGILDWQTELYFAQGISDSNKTCRAAATVALWTWVVEMAKYKSLVRLATGGQVETQETALPGSDINVRPQPVVAQGVLVTRTFKALDEILTPKFLEHVYETIHYSNMPDQQLMLLAECIKYFADMSEEFKQRVNDNSRLTVLLQNRYPYFMSKK
ncbi:hypothetical protein LPJ53_003542 [Coemansia erecta]|uniref:RNA polymerase II-associated protein 1 N-terminal domain-containing protein n=1 Tax=Coemansia erecta TaxID=147472 RepID=A0A9W7Y1V7_9FUNG|nr:hypothetical protein LPJ53_003542 [Coemansia erecta]